MYAGHFGDLAAYLRLQQHAEVDMKTFLHRLIVSFKTVIGPARFCLYMDRDEATEHGIQRETDRRQYFKTVNHHEQLGRKKVSCNAF